MLYNNRMFSPWNKICSFVLENIFQARSYRKMII